MKINAIWRDPQLRAVAAACVTLGFAVGVFAISFGVTAVSAGASVAQTCVMSLLVFTGASQFSAVSVIGAGGSAASAFGGAALLAARNSVYGLAMAPHLKGPLGVRLLAAQWTIDESTAMAAAQTDEVHRRAAFWITGGSIYLFWNIGTLIGAVLGSAIDPSVYGLDAAFPAAFLAMLWPLLRDADVELARLAALPNPIFLHGNIEMWNVLVDQMGRLRLLDFEDVMRGQPIHDIAITLYYGMERPDYQELAAAFRAGYTSVRDWPDVDEPVLRLLMAARATMLVNHTLLTEPDPRPVVARLLPIIPVSYTHLTLPTSDLV